jgi:putative glutamine amidotransferase
MDANGPRPVIGVSMSALCPEGVRKHACNDAYVAAVGEAGGLPMLLPSVGGDVERSAAEYLDRVAGLVLTGGDDVHPSFYGEAPRPELGDVDEVRDRFELALAREAHRRGMPTLAICRGLQVANVALGGSLIQDIPTQVRTDLRHSPAKAGGTLPSHDVDVADGSRLRSILGVGRAEVNSSHHQSADRVAPDLRVSARSEDGVVEALEDPRHPYFVGVQWHPERAPDDPASRALFRSFLSACRTRP